MAIRTKSSEEIEKLAEGGRRLRGLLEELAALTVPGATGKQLDAHAQKRIAELGAKPAFLGYKGYSAALCISVNDAVVHGLPNDEPFKEGDVVSIDAGIVYEDLYTDSAITVAIGNVPEITQRLLRVTKEALAIGIKTAQVGATTGDIGHAIQTYVEREGFGVVRQLVGHGVGYEVHEEPPVPNYGKAGSGHTLSENLVIAIEPMVTVGDPATTTASDGWTVITKDGSLAAHFEHTVAITPQGPRILT